MRRIQYLLFILVTMATSHSVVAEDSLGKLRNLEKAFAQVTDSASREKVSLTRELAHAYALALLQDNPDVSRYASDALEKSNNVWILGNAAYMLQSQYNQMLQRGLTNKHAAFLAERYFLRARTLDPNLDRNAILPQIDLQQLAREREIRAIKEKEMARKFDEAAGQISRLDPAAFSGLPPQIVGVLRSRNCTVPQPTAATTPRNVVQGAFFESGRLAWAVLCSVEGRSSILIFRHAEDREPESLVRMPDRNYLQGDDEYSISYSREIRAVGRDYILDHDREFSGEKPSQMNHQGIEDAFLEKASSVWYFSEGKWYQLPGAD